jgi:thiol-disulfide isomerase/thioredoxin
MLTVMAALAVAAGPEPGTDAVTLRRVSYDGMGDAVKGSRGKVVLVDFWGSFCGPCKAEFPRLVELHQRHAREGLAAMSVSLDVPDDPAAEAAAKAFLVRQRATFTNLLLAETPAVWQPKLKTNSVPCVFLFDRKGRLRYRWNDGGHYDEIGTRVTELLAEAE